MNYIEKMKQYPEMSELAAILESGAPGILEITTTMAARIMTEFNKSNRDVHDAWVVKLANDMQKGNWKQNGDSISFYDDGSLADGQHRCSAISKAGMPLTVIVMGGLEKDAILTKDTGHARSAEAALKMYGYDNAKETAAIAKSVWQWIYHGNPGGAAPTHQELKTWADMYRARLSAVVSSTVNFAEDHVKKLSTTSVGSMLWRSTDEDHNWDESDILEFLSEAVSGTAETESSPSARAAAHLDKASQKKPSMSEMKKIAMMVKAFNLHKEGKESVTPGAVLYNTKGKGRDKSFPDFSVADLLEESEAA